MKRGIYNNRPLAPRALIAKLSVPPAGLAIFLFLSVVSAIDLERESLGGIRLGDKIDWVIRELGKPQARGHEDCGDDFGLGDVQWQVYEWTSKGIDVSAYEGVVISIIIYGKSAAKTSRGIGIGNSKEEIIETYPEWFDKGSDEFLIFNENEWELGDDIFLRFEFMKNKVKSVSLSELMCE